MAVDGHVDIKALFDKSRLVDTIHDGDAVVEAHAEVEAAMCQAFGIQNGANIISSIFGTVASDGSWSMAKFSRETTTSEGKSAVGWELKDSAHAVRIVQVSGAIQIWYQQDDGTWAQRRDLEFIEDGELVDLSDVSIDLDDASPTETVKVVGQETNPKFGLGADTTTSGAEAFVDLTDVITPPIASYLIGNEGAVLESFDDDGTIKIKSKLIPALVEESLPDVGMLEGQLTMKPYELTRPADWNAVGANGSWNDRANWLGLDSDGNIHLSKDGIYRITFSWIMNSGSLLNTRIYDGIPDPSVVALFFEVGTGVDLFPPRHDVYPEAPWAFNSSDGQIYRGLHIGHYFDGFTELMVSSGGSDAVFNPKWTHNMVGGDRQFTVWIEIERLN